MTLEDFADMTIKVIREDGIANYLPILAYPDTLKIHAIQGIPDDVDHRGAIQDVIRRSGDEKREFFFGVRSAPGRITAGHFRPGKTTEFVDIVETSDGYSTVTVETCEWWKVS